MDVKEPVKRLIEKATGAGIPAPVDALARVKAVKPRRLKFRDDGYVPNNPSLPLLYYRKAVAFERGGDPAALLEAIFNANGWGDAWRNGIYDYVHYHPQIHEVLGIARGSASLRLGGNKGVTLTVSGGDVIVIPAGVGHECLRAGKNFLVVGAYPPSGTYSECRGTFHEHATARARIKRVARLRSNPLFGTIRQVW